MMRQLELGDAAKQLRRMSRGGDPATSAAAAGDALKFVGDHESRILEALRGMKEGGTKDEIAAATRLDSVAVARRMRRLADSGAVKVLGTRPLVSGRSGQVWGLS